MMRDLDLEPARGSLLLSHLLRRSVDWSDVQIQVKLVVPEPAGRQSAEENLTSLLKEMRVDAKGEVILSEGRSFKEVLTQSSKGADLVMLGMAEPGSNFAPYYDRLHHLADGMPTTVFVLAAQNLPFRRILH